jgi:hypothetical protein
VSGAVSISGLDGQGTADLDFVLPVIGFEQDRLPR